MKKDERFEQILKHAAQVFFEKGYDRASIRDIAKQAEMSLAGLYYYFRSKEELLYLVQKQVFTYLLNEVREKLSGESDPISRLTAFIRNHLSYFVENLVEMKVLSHEYECLKGPLHEEIADLRREYFQVVEEIVTEIAKTRATNEIEPRIAVLSLFGMMNWLYTWYRPDVDGGPDGVADQMTALFLDGLLAGR
ncbi:MAG: TetR/AcrR family transcriptional regulator [Planctomycetota bacterium]